MTKRYPESSIEGDEKAFAYLRKFFASGEWKFFQVREILSGVEYGEDLLIKVVENGVVREAKFIVQSKTFNTPKQTAGKRLKTKLKVSTLNSLAEANLPVILFYLNTIQDKGYWIWLDDWYYKNYKPEWENKKELSVSISTNQNQLDANAVKKIRQRVWQEHEKQRVLRQAQFSSMQNQSFNFKFSSNQHGYSIVVEAKTSTALQDNPITIDLTLDDGERQKLEAATELGVPVTVKGVGSIKGLPSWMTDDVDFNQEASFRLVPYSDKVSNLQIDYLNAQPSSLFTAFAVFKQVQPGTHYQKWSGSPKNYPVIIDIIFDAKKPETLVSLAYSGGRNPKDLLWFSNLLNTLQKTDAAKITNLDTSSTFELRNYNLSLTQKPLREAELQLLEDMILINETVNKNLEVPSTNLPVTDSENIRGLAEAIRTGKTNRWSAIQRLDDEKMVMLIETSKQEYVNFLEQVVKRRSPWDKKQAKLKRYFPRLKSSKKEQSDGKRRESVRCESHSGYSPRDPPQVQR